MNCRWLWLFFLIVLVLAPVLSLPESQGQTTGESHIRIYAIAPEHVGLTSTSQPTLYWYLSDLTPRPFILKLIEDTSRQTILVKLLPPPMHTGVQRIRLKDFGVVLREGHTYTWSIALVVAPVAPFPSLETSGIIEFVDCRHFPGFAEGCPAFWYDVLESISKAIDRHPESPKLQAKLARLMKQAERKSHIQQSNNLPE